MIVADEVDTAQPNTAAVTDSSEAKVVGEAPVVTLAENKPSIEETSAPNPVNNEVSFGTSTPIEASAEASDTQASKPDNMVEKDLVGEKER